MSAPIATNPAEDVSSKIPPAPLSDAAAAQRKAIILVSSCTVVSASAQLLMKAGMTHVTGFNPIALATNLPLVAGYALYGVFCLMMILALRQGELSLVYPIISLSYVWVAGLSYAFFHEPMKPLKIAGILTVMLGVAMLGRRSSE